jgi:hypothetical protein
LAEHIKPQIDDWEENGKYPSKELWKKMGEFGLLAA